MILTVGIGDDPPIARLVYGESALRSLTDIKAASIHCCITSPPYWGLRSYGDGQDEEWGEVRYRPLSGLDMEVVVPPMTCSLGLEKSFSDYVGHLVAVFRGVARVMRPEGVLWLNLGDCFAQAKGHGHWESRAAKGDEKGQMHAGLWAMKGAEDVGLRPKNLVGIPWRAAMALQADGWYLRAICPWLKRNVLPEPVTDRPTVAHEYIFMLGHPDSGGRYFYDMNSVRVPHAEASVFRSGHTDLSGRNRRTSDWFYDSLQRLLLKEEMLLQSPDGEPLSFVVNPKPYKGAHFATFPEELVEPMVRATTSDGGVCSRCGSPRLRITGKPEPTGERGSGNVRRKKSLQPDSRSGSGRTIPWSPNAVPTVGWQFSCSCERPEIGRAVVLDPFSGSGTAGKVATRLGRDYVGLDAQAVYLPLAEARIQRQDPPMDTEAEEKGGLLDLFGE